MKNREIKFRAWNKHQKVFHYFGIEAAALEDGAFGKLEFADLEFLQFTGLKDKNGKEIYEGDILEFTDKWEWYRGSYAIKMMFANDTEKDELKKKYGAEPMHRFEVQFDPHEGYNISRYDLSQDRFEVIGNIYENPELLK